MGPNIQARIVSTFSEACHGTLDLGQSWPITPTLYIHIVIYMVRSYSEARHGTLD